MTPRHHPDTDSSTAYTPMSDDRRQRRRDDEADAEIRRWWQRVIKPTEIAALTALLIALATAFGFTHRMLPGDRLNVVEARTTRVEQRVDSLSDRLLFATFLQCQQAKASGSVIPAWATARCDSIIQRRLAP